jgi:hypothetical protein
MQLWATLWCRAQTARDGQTPNQDAGGAHIPSWCRCLAVLAPRHLRLGGKAVSWSTGAMSMRYPMPLGIGIWENTIFALIRRVMPPRLRSRAQTTRGQPSLEPVVGIGRWLRPLSSWAGQSDAMRCHAMPCMSRRANDVRCVALARTIGSLGRQTGAETEALHNPLCAWGQFRQIRGSGLSFGG